MYIQEQTVSHYTHVLLSNFTPNIHDFSSKKNYIFSIFYSFFFYILHTYHQIFSIFPDKTFIVVFFFSEKYFFLNILNYIFSNNVYTKV